MDEKSELRRAASRGDENTVGKLLLANVPADCPGAAGETPLYCAVVAGHAACVEALLKYGASPTYAINSGETPLLAAARHEHQDCCERLCNAVMDSHLLADQKRALLEEAASLYPNVAGTLKIFLNKLDMLIEIPPPAQPPAQREGRTAKGSPVL